MLEAFKLYFTFVFDVAAVIQLLIISVSTILVFNPKYDRKKAPYLVGLQLIGLFGITLLLEASIFALSSVVTFIQGINFGLVYIFTVSIYAAIFSRKKIHQNFVLATVMISTTIIVVSIGDTASLILEDSINEFDSVYIKIISYILILAFASLVYFYKYQNIDIGEKNSAVVTVSSIIFTMYSFVFSWSEGHGYTVNAEKFTRVIFLVILFILYIVNILIFVLTMLAARENKKVLDLSIQLSKKEFQLDLVNQSEENLKEIKKIRHELKNHITYISTLLQEEKYDEANKYFEKIIGKFSPDLYGRIDCGNNVINSIVNFEIAKAISNNIDFTQKIVVPNSIRYDVSDIYSLISNLIDSAFEYCNGKSEAYKKVDLEITVHQNNFFIYVINSLTEEDAIAITKSDGLTTSKKNKRFHGYGLSIVKDICHKYEGEFVFYVKDKRFVAEAILKM